MGFLGAAISSIIPTFLVRITDDKGGTVLIMFRACMLSAFKVGGSISHESNPKP